jgi:hypothetical protein
MKKIPVKPWTSPNPPCLAEWFLNKWKAHRAKRNAIQRAYRAKVK